MNVVKLKNGAEEAEPLVTVMMMSLANLMKERPLALYDLAMKCRDKNYQFFGDNEKHLQDLELVGISGDIHSSVRNVVLSAVHGDDLDMALSSPVAVP